MKMLLITLRLIKGPASLTYGSDALAGVVNLLPASAYHLDTIQGQYLKQIIRLIMV